MTDAELQQLQAQELGDFPAVSPAGEQSMLTNAGRVRLGDFLDFLEAELAPSVSAAKSAAETAESSQQKAKASETAADVSRTQAQTSRVVAENAAATAKADAASASKSADNAKASENAMSATLHAFETGARVFEALRLKLDDGRQIEVLGAVENGQPTLSCAFATTLSANALSLIRLAAGENIIAVRAVVMNGQPTLDFTLETQE